MHTSAEAHKAATGHSLDHVDEQLLTLKGRMDVPTGREMAEKRHQFMETFVSRFLEEWGSE